MKLAVALMAVTGLYGQNRIEGPVTGWVYDGATRSLRSISGVPGAAVFGQPVEAGPLAAAAASRAHDYAVAIADDGGIRLLPLRSGSVTGEIKGLPAGKVHVTLSSRGRAATFLYPEAGLAYNVHPLPGSPEAQRVDFGADGTPVRVALSDSGNLLIGIYPDGRAMVFHGNGNRWPLAVDGGMRDAVFLPQSEELLVGGAGGVWLFRGLYDGVRPERLAATSALRVDAVRTGQLVLVLAEDRTLMAIDRAAGGTRAIECSCDPTTLDALSDHVFRVTADGAAPMWLLDAGGADVKTVFVPGETKPSQ